MCYINSHYITLHLTVTVMTLNWMFQGQGYPRSKVMVLIESPLVVSYLTSIVSNVVSRTAFTIFDAKILWPWIRRAQDHSRSKVMVRINSTCGFGLPPKTIHNHISWDPTLVASLVKVSGGLRSVERSTRFVWQTHWLTHSHIHKLIL